VSNLKEWLNPLLPAENRVQIADGEIDRLCAQLAAAEENGLDVPGLTICRSDGRCQYAIDHGAEDLGHCPRGKCSMPDHGGPVD